MHARPERFRLGSEAGDERKCNEHRKPEGAHTALTLRRNSTCVIKKTNVRACRIDRCMAVLLGLAIAVTSRSSWQAPVSRGKEKAGLGGPAFSCTLWSASDHLWFDQNSAGATSDNAVNVASGTRTGSSTENGPMSLPNISAPVL